MASYLRPRRGTNALATSQAIVLKKGEVFFEIGNSGTPTTGANAKAFGKIKMGDGTTAYSNLGYFVDVDTTAVAWDNTGYTSATSASQGADFYTNLNNMVPTATVKTIFTNTKALLYNLATKVTKLNNDKAEKSSLSTVATSGSYNDLSNKPTIPTALSQLTADSTHRLVTDTEKSTWNNKGNKLYLHTIRFGYCTPAEMRAKNFRLNDICFWKNKYTDYYLGYEYRIFDYNTTEKYEISYLNRGHQVTRKEINHKEYVPGSAYENVNCMRFLIPTSSALNINQFLTYLDQRNAVFLQTSGFTIRDVYYFPNVLNFEPRIIFTYERFESTLNMGYRKLFIKVFPEMLKSWQDTVTGWPA